MSTSILICTVGESYWVIPESYDFLSNDTYFKGDDNANERNLVLQTNEDKRVNIDEIWAIMTEDKKNLLDRCQLLAQWYKLENPDLQNPKFQFRLFCAPGTTELDTHLENKSMLETILRTVMKARSVAGKEGKVYLSIAGGRKNMSSNLQQTDLFFGADGIFHVITKNDNALEDLLEGTDTQSNIYKKFNLQELDHEQYKRHKDKLYSHICPVSLLSTAGWSGMIQGTIHHSNKGKPLSSQNFPMEPVVSFPSDWEAVYSSRFEVAQKGQNFVIKEEKKANPLVFEIIQNAVNNSKKFLDLVLSAGFASSTLYHDLCGTEATIKNSVQPILSYYLAGISDLTKKPKSSSLHELNMSTYKCYNANFSPFGEKILRPALDLCNFPVQEQAQNSFQVTRGRYRIKIIYNIEIFEKNLNLGLLLILLRNLLKNAIENTSNYEVECKIEKHNKRFRLAVTNEVSEKDIQEKPWMRVFNPFSTTNNDDDGRLHGLGGVAMRKAAECLGSKLEVEAQQNKVTFFVYLTSEE
ncbi:MAG: GHKL domain-containing protein [Candidatus Brocadiae bacterium]|nr:GHKL domain-containing protein [Candidatus Brocadiia bacterium]